MKNMKPMTKGTLKRKKSIREVDAEFFRVNEEVVNKLHLKVSSESFERLLREALYDWRSRNGW